MEVNQITPEVNHTHLSLSIVNFMDFTYLKLPHVIREFHADLGIVLGLLLLIIGVGVNGVRQTVYPLA
jgi:hypothetical protein